MTSGPVRGLMILDSDSTESPGSRGMFTPRCQVLHDGLLKVLGGSLGGNNQATIKNQGGIKNENKLILFFLFCSSLI